MQQQNLDDLAELRFRQLERLTSALLEGQQNTVQLLTEHTKLFIKVERRLDGVEQRLDNVEQRLDNVEQRLKRVEELLTLALDDLAFIRDILKPKQ